MTSRSLLSAATMRCLLAASALVGPLVPWAGASLRAQITYPAVTEVDPATALSRYLRMLAANPRDLASLTGAGRAALAVGDANAALGFYARAEEIAPRNGRIKAGLASALVQMEQPRAALKLFDDAVAFGVPVGDIASDRGLAYDLVGENRRAQADYAVALRMRDDDETARRLALSMAVSGDRAGALAVLDPLLRKRDGGGERTRAFVLALTGDHAEAANAVRAAMPGAQASAMLGFMNRLNGLNPAQKALAVNFGYFPSDGRAYTAAELFADARAAPLPAPGTAIGTRMARADTPLIPYGEALGPRLASNETASVAPRRRPGQEEQVVPPPHVLTAPIPGVTPVLTGRRAALTARQGTANPATGAAPAAPVTVTPLLPAVPATDAFVPPSPSGAVGMSNARPIGGAATGIVGSVASPPSTGAATPIGTPAYTAAAPAAVAPAAAFAPGDPGGPVAAPRALGPAAVPVRIATAAVPAGAGGTAPAPAPAIEPVQPVTAPPARPAATRTVARPAAVQATRAETAEGARTSRGETAKGRTAATSAKGKAADAKAEGAGRKDAKGVKLAALDPKTGKPLSTKDDDRPSRNGRADAKSDRNGGSGDGAREGRPGATTGRDRSAGAKSGGSGRSKAGEKDEPATKAKPDTKTKSDTKAKSEAKVKSEAKDKPAGATKPERYWVQVASGSNKANLDRAWSDVKGKAPRQLSGQSTYTTPWRASNRLLIGPFKSADEAQAKVNALAKAGVSGIQFTTRAGADVEKVAAK